jgi:formate dehydrogenase iron-sulfur subunit
MEPACAKACPTDSIQFGELGDLREVARKREAQLHAQGVNEARLYGADEEVYGGLNAFFLLMDEPEAYNLPNAENAVLPGRNNVPGYFGGFVTAILAVLAAIIARRQRNMEPLEPSE